MVNPDEPDVGQPSTLRRGGPQASLGRLQVAGGLGRRRQPGVAIRERLRRDLLHCGIIHLDRGPFPLQPLLLSASTYDELVSASNSLLALLKTLVARHPGGIFAFVEDLGYVVNGDEYPFFAEDASYELAHCDAMARPDILMGSNGPQFLEFNVSGALGGLLEVHIFRNVWHFAYGADGLSGFDSADPLWERASFLADACADLGVDAVALVGNTAAYDHTPRYYEVEVEILRWCGLEARYVDVGSPKDVRTLADAQGQELVFLAATPGEMLERGIPHEALQSVLKSGCAFFPSQLGRVLANKLLLAKLSAGAAWMTDEDRSLVAKYIPWTREVASELIDWQDRQLPIREFLLGHREDLVLKRGDSRTGMHVFIGRFTEDAAWASAVDHAIADGTFVVQQYVEGLSCEVEMIATTEPEESVRQVVPLLSPILLGGRPAGCYGRHLPRQSGQVISDASAVENAVFIEPARPAASAP